MEKQKLKKIYLLPNVITAFGLSCGLFVIFKMSLVQVDQVSAQTLTASAGILLLAAFADLIDGAIARVIKAESAFGGIFDSLADAISFGVAPSVIILKSFAFPSNHYLSFLLMIAATVFSLCGVLRLVRFNVSALEAKGNSELTLANQKNFTGLPIPAAAAAAVSLNLFFFSDELRSIWELSNSTRAWIIVITLLLLGYFMVSRWKFPSIKNLHIRVATFKAVIWTVVSAILLFYGLLHYFSVVFVILSCGYIAIAAVLSIIRIIAGRKSKTLEDFEPEPEEEEFDDDNV